MTLDKKAYDLTCRILANIHTKDHHRYISDVHIMILTVLVKTYIQARRDEAAGHPYDDTIIFIYPNLIRPKLVKK